MLKIFHLDIYIYFFPFCAVNFCDYSTETVNICESNIKTFTFEWIIVGKYGHSEEKCAPDTVNGMCFFPFASIFQK